MVTLEHTPPIWHDVSEIFDYLSCLSLKYLYLYQYSKVYINGQEWFYIDISYKDKIYLITPIFINNLKL